MDQLTAISYAAAIMVKSCIYTMKSNITETENGVSNDSVAMMNKINQVESTICPAQCSGNGNCSQQKCICKSGTTLDKKDIVLNLLWVMYLIFQNSDDRIVNHQNHQT